MKSIVIVGEIIVSQSNSYFRIQRWIKDWHPELGTLVWGLTGKETLIEIDVIKPKYTLIETEYFAQAA